MATTTHENKQKRGIASFMSTYKPSSGRHLKPESKPEVDKTHVLRNWFSSRKPKPRSQASDHHAPGDHHVETNLDGGGGGRRGVVVEAARKSVSHVETNLVSVAAFLQVKVLVSDMPGFMQVHAFRSARRTYDSLDKFSPKHMAYNLKKLHLLDDWYVWSMYRKPHMGDTDPVIQISFSWYSCMNSEKYNTICLSFLCLNGATEQQFLVQKISWERVLDLGLCSTSLCRV